MGNIDTKKQNALKSLQIKFETIDKAKKSFGYISIISLSLLYGIIILNDTWKLLCNLWMIYKEYKQEKNLRIKQTKESEEREKINQIQIDMDKMYSDDLEIKLERVHIQLMKAFLKNKKRSLN